MFASVCIYLVAICGAQSRPSVVELRLGKPAIESALADLIGKPEACAWKNVTPEAFEITASDASVTLGAPIVVQLPRVAVHVTGTSHKGYKLDTVLSIEPKRIEWRGEFPIHLELDLRLQNQVDCCPDQYTGHFWRITVVKPIILKPFDVHVRVPAEVVLADGNLKVKLGTFKPLTGSIPVGVIGDGPNLWGTIDPLDAPSIDLTGQLNVGIRKFKFTVTVPNPLPEALGRLSGRTLTFPIK